jgi:serine/threonine protein kinase
MVDRTDQHIGNYRLTRRIASGGMADVYLASHIYLQTQVAVKILHSWMSEYEEKAFLQEARIIAGLNHPHIIRIVDFGVDTNDNRSFAYLVMEYASSSLANLYPVGTPVPFATIRTYVSDIASALNYAHEQGVVHRDVKPSNILLSVNDTVLLSDFGIATFINADKESTLDRTITGTPIFMAPEQIMGKARPASDQYALGIMVYEWLCGFPPFTGSTTQLFAQQMNMAPPPLRSRLSSISPEVEQVVFIALAKKPEDRFSNINAFANALSTALRSAESIPLPLTGPQPPSPYATEPASIPQVQLPLSPQQSAYGYGSLSYLSQNPASGAFPQTPIDTGDQQYITAPSPNAPWGVQDPAYTQGPPTISDAGYFPPAYDRGGSNTAQTYFPSQSPTGYLPSGSISGISGSPPRTFFSLLLALLAAPFIFVTETIVKLTQQAGGQVQPDLPPTARLSSGGGGWPSEVPAKTRERFFIIYHREDQLWAEWIAWHLEQAGYSAILPSWDFYAGSNLNMEITRASTKADCVIIVLSPAFFSTPDSLRNLKRDLSGKQDTVLPVIVHEYKIAHKHPLNDLVAISLVNLNKEAAQARLLSAVRRERQKPMSQPVFPPEFMTPVHMASDNGAVLVSPALDVNTIRLPETSPRPQTRTQVDADIASHNPNITIVLRSEI